jgi:hypothetical protein
MKSIFSFILIFIVPQFLWGQASSDVTFAQFEKNNKDVFEQISNDTTKILTQPAINLFFVRRLAFYSGTADDISLFSNYAFADVAGGKLSVGKNFRFNDYKTQRLEYMFSAGINAESDGDKKFAFLYRDGKFRGRMGIDFNFTYFGSGTIWFDNSKQTQSFDRKMKHKLSDKDIMKANRYWALEEVKLKWKADSINFYTTLNSSLNNDTSILNNREAIISEFKKKQFKEYSTYLITKEADKFENDSLFNAYRMWWYSLRVNLPATGSRYLVAPDFNSFAVEREQWRITISTQFNFLFESLRKGKIYTYLGVGVIHQNSIETNDLKLITLDEYKGLGGRDSSVLNTGSSLYVGQFKRFNDGNAYGKVIYYFPKYDWIGASFFTEYQFGERGQILNMYAGLPMSFAGKGDSRVNLEVQFRFSNIINTLSSARNDEKKFSMGIKLGIPFGQTTF